VVVTIRKSPWHVTLANGAGVMHVEEAEAPAFKMDGKWNEFLGFKLDK